MAELVRFWEYDRDNGGMLARCPACSGRVVIGRYDYKNPFRFCPYCGLYLESDQKQFSRKHGRAYGYGEKI